MLASIALACLPLLAENPDPVYHRWGLDVNEEYWLWEQPGSTQVIWLLPGGAWTQGPGEFLSGEMSPLIQPFYDAGISVGVSGYGTEQPFPFPELALQDLVVHTRVDLGYQDVTLVGRSSGAHMALFTGITGVGLGAPDRVCVMQVPFSVLPLFGPDEVSDSLPHFDPSAQTIGDLPAWITLFGSSAYWPLVVPPDPDRQFCVIGPPKPLEFAPIPLPTGQLLFPEDSHAAVTATLQAMMMELGGWDVDYVDTWNGGALLDQVEQTQLWIEAELKN